ncbi:EscU/YscU/HrcU family type III secretion system export apparatus switch protein [Paraburkholderia dinghuensis]|uniref:Flagellar biosynthesis protein FlhB n=1 Tax=Paraburkholderia dinghuensis TaxID=2305225 RepID=A0A3N6MQL7_9BURK|nr:EscU/YscU/HrcU family type III secretion system export apparatus switch protein [Paraburkholderia dinghuensis]RQH06008.1 flagellar biosynthesis protein FlhB [Paraburkholderia dinghuensis]
MSRQHRKTAAALAYDTPSATDGAPRVVAKGYGIVADTIIQRAKEAGLYVHQSPEMVRLLMQVDLDSKIPPQLYQAVAELLAWLHRLEAADTADAAQPAEAKPGADVSPGAAVQRLASPVRALPPPPFRTSSSD